jgi:pimeloyl-ACP methyl ester carboxylesterase
MKKLYLFSGLGADYRVLQDLDFTGYEVTFIEWIKPVEDEPINDYAKRLTKQIECKRPILIGLSFGGMIAIEVGKLIKTEKIILIASVKTKNEIPFYYRLVGRFNFHKLLPTSLLKQPNFASDWLFGIKNKKDKELLANILHDTDPIFLRWAIDKIVNWGNVIIPQNIKHIHGTSDRILPYKFVLADLTILGGGHFMTMDRAKELTQKIRELL